MKNPYGRPRGGIKRFAIAAGILILVLMVLSGGLLASNYKHTGNLIKVFSLIRSQYLEEVGTTALMDGAISGMVESLDDPYSAYLDAETYAHLREQIRGSFGGVGVLVGVSENYLTVVRAYENTPAAKEGIRIGDKIAAIDGQDVKGMDLETAVNIIRGPVGTEIKFSLLRENQDRPLEVTLTREEISVPTVEGEMVQDTGIAHVVISQFNEKTPGELREILNNFKKQGLEALIIDLRNNPGGELISAKDVADILVPAGPIVTVNYRKGKDYTYHAGDEYLDLPLVLLVNENSASASEIVAGAVKDTGVGKLVGTTTFGKGIVQTIFPLDKGAALKITTARYLTPNGHNIHKKGIKPDIEVAQSVQDLLGGKDLQLQKAIEILSN